MALINSTIIITFFLIFAGCMDQQKIEEEKLVKIYTDLVIAKDSLGNDNLGFVSARSKIFAKYKITEKDYISTLKYYSEDVNRWESFFNKAIAYADSLNVKKKPL